LPGERDGGDLVVFGDGQRAESAFFKFHRDAAKRTVEFVVDEGGADAVTQQVCAAAQCGGRGLVVGETAGVGDDGNPQRFSGNGVEFPTGLAGEAPDHFTGGGDPAFDPVQGAEERVGAVVVDVDDGQLFSQRLDGFRQTVERAAIQGDQEVEFLFPRFFRRKEFFDTRQKPGAAEAVAFGGGDGFDARAVEQVRQGDHTPERVAVRTDVPGDQDALRSGDGFDQLCRFGCPGFECVLHARVRSTDLSGTADDVLVGRQFFKPHRPAGMKLVGADAHLRAHAELAAVREPGGGVDIHGCRVDLFQELLGVACV